MKGYGPGWRPRTKPSRKGGRVGASPRIRAEGCATGKIDESLGLVQNSQGTGDIWEKSCASMATNWGKESSKGKIRTIHIMCVTLALASSSHIQAT